MKVTWLAGSRARQEQGKRRVLSPLVALRHGKKRGTDLNFGVNESKPLKKVTTAVRPNDQYVMYLRAERGSENQN